MRKKVQKPINVSTAWLWGRKSSHRPGTGSLSLNAHTRELLGLWVAKPTSPVPPRLRLIVPPFANESGSGWVLLQQLSSLKLHPSSRSPSRGRSRQEGNTREGKLTDHALALTCSCLQVLLATFLRTLCAHIHSAGRLHASCSAAACGTHPYSPPCHPLLPPSPLCISSRTNH